MEDKLLDSKRLKFGVYESALASLLFVIYNFLFIQLYGFVPKDLRSVEILSFVASFFLEATFAFAAITVACSKKVDIKAAAGMKKKVNGKIVWLGFWIAVVSIIGLGDITNLFLQILTACGYKSVLSDFSINTVWQYLGYLIASCAAPAFCEELLFRGTIMSGLKEYGAKIAIIVSAVIFTFMHGNAEQTVHQMIIGVLIGYIFWKSGNLWLGVIIHFFNNFLSVTASFVISLLNKGQAAEAASSPLGGLGMLYLIVETVITALVALYLLKLLLDSLLAEDHKLNGENVENTNLSTITIDGQESVVEMAIESDSTGVKSDMVDENKAEVEKKPISTSTVVFFAISGLYLAFEWIATLLIGFGLV